MCYYYMSKPKYLVSRKLLGGGLLGFVPSQFYRLVCACLYLYVLSMKSGM